MTPEQTATLREMRAGIDAYIRLGAIPFGRYHVERDTLDAAIRLAESVEGLREIYESGSIREFERWYQKFEEATNNG